MAKIIRLISFASKVNSVQEACAKCFAVHLLKFEICKPHEKTKHKHQNARSIGEKLKTDSLQDRRIISFSVVNISEKLQLLMVQKLF